MEGFEAAQKAGKVRFVGFSAHSVEAAMALMDGYDFDTILFPFNYATWAVDFGPQVMEKAKEKGMGILCLKAMARGPWPEGAERRYDRTWYEPLDQPEEADLALRFTLSHPVTAAIPPGDPGLFEMAVKLAKGFRPITAEQERILKEKAAAGTPLFRFPSKNA
jgi:predicted aldo/keto reductase-like oxidoreductase